MKEQKNIRQELREQKAEYLLEKQGGIPQWELPSGYLEQLTDEVLNATTAKPKAGKIVRFNRFLRMAAAAVVVLALGYWYWYPQNAGTTLTASAEPDWSGISTEDLQDYVASNLDDFEVDLLAASAVEADNEMVPGTGISTEAIEEYLEAEDWLDEMDVSELFDENI